MLTAQSQSSHGYSQTPGLLRGLPSLACRSAGEGPARARQSISVAIWHFAAHFPRPGRQHTRCVLKQDSGAAMPRAGRQHTMYVLADTVWCCYLSCFRGKKEEHMRMSPTQTLVHSHSPVSQQRVAGKRGAGGQRLRPIRASRRSPVFDDALQLCLELAHRRLLHNPRWQVIINPHET